MKKIIINAGLALALVFSTLLSPSYSVISSAEAAFNCSEYKTRLSNQSAKDAATDTPSWAKGQKPCKSPTNENGSAFAKRLLDDKYGSGNYKTKTNTEFSKIKKYGDRAFE